MKPVVTALLAVCVSITVAAQIRVPKIPLPRDLPLPNIDRFLRGESPISTSLRDARVEVPFLDRLDVKFGDLSTLRNDRGSFTVTPGRWTADLHSFCFRPGTRGPRPTDGNGYVSAPLVGPHGEIFADMLTKYAMQRDIGQQDMQVLIWALLSRTKIRLMNPRMQALAARVLTPAQIVALDSGALDVIPPNLRRRAFNALPAEVRAIATVENRIRDVLSRANHSYAELERIAVLQGPEPRDGRTIPKQRWTVHPNGYLIRYVPRGVARTTVQIAMPPNIQVRRDGNGRVVSVDFGDGRRTETEYDDAIPAFEPPGNLMAVGYAFKSIKLIRRGANGRPEEVVLRDRGWTFVTRPATRLAPRTGVFFASFVQPPSWIDRFQTWKERYDHWNEEYRERAEWYRDRWERLNEPPPDVEQTLRDLEDLEHYRDGIDAALRGDTGDRLDWLIDHQERMNAALERATLTLGTLPDGSDDDDHGLYATPPDVAVPGSAGSQRLGISGRA
jgi:hypothetical protein